MTVQQVKTLMNILVVIDKDKITKDNNKEINSKKKKKT